MVFGCWAFFVIPAVFLACSVVLRTAVYLANKCIGGRPPQDLDLDGEGVDEWIGYREIRPSVPAIPEPSIGKSLFCVFSLGCVVLIVDFLMSETFVSGPRWNQRGREEDYLVSHAVSFLICFPIAAGILSAILPTRFGRACLVLLFVCGVFLALIGLFAGAVGYLFS